MITYTKTPSKDSMILSANPTTNYGTYTRMEVVTLTGSAETIAWRGIIGFDLTDLKASSPSILTATLGLYYYAKGVNYTTTQTLYAAKVTRTNWTEAGVTWNKYDGVNDWTAGGGDRVTSNPAVGAALVDTSVGKWINIDVKAIVVDAIDNVSDLLNMLLYRNTGIANNDGIMFYSRDYTTNTTLIPKLTITYSSGSLFFAQY